MKTDIIGYVNILIGVTDFLLGVFVWFGNKKRDINKSYAFCTLSMGLWSISLFFYSTPIVFSSEIWLKIVYVLAYLMTISQIDFAVKYHKAKNKLINGVFISAIALGLSYGTYLLLIKDSVVLSVTQNLGVLEASMGADYRYYALPIVLSLFFLFSSFIISGKNLKGIAKRQNNLYWIGGFLMIAPLFVMDFVLPIFFNNTSLYKFSALGNILWSIIIAYSIINTRFLDVRVVIGNFLKTLVKITFITLVILLTIFYFIPFLSFQQDLRTILFSIPISVFLALIFNVLISGTDKIIEKKLIYSAYNPIEELQKYSNSNSNTLSVDEIVNNTIDSLSKTLKPKSIFISVKDKRSNSEIFQKSNLAEKYDPEDYSLFTNSWEGLNSNRILIFSEIKETPSSGKKIIDDRKMNIVNFMNEYGIEIAIPLQENSFVSGLIMISEKQDNSVFNLGDIDFLESIAQNMSLRVGQASLYEEVKSFNNSLQQKVDLQTGELQQKVKELQEARRKEADMIDIMGHELRTPMSIVKLNTDLLHNFSSNVTLKKEDFVKYVGRIKEAVETEIKLINTLLSSAKLEGDKIEINPEKVDIIDQIKMALHAHEAIAKQKNLELITHFQPHTPAVFSDLARTVEVVNNLIDNAVKYTDKGSVTVKTEIEGSFVRVSIIDTGIGLANTDITKLGTKFFRTGNYITSQESDNFDIVRPGGTGLGLYVTFNLIKKMGGDIHVESDLGNGSNFTFTLPIYTGQAIKSVKDSNDMFTRLGLKKDKIQE